MADPLRADPAPVLVALGLLATALLARVLRRRRRKISGPVERSEPAADVQSVFGQAGGRNVDTSNSVFHSNFVPSVSQLDANEVDAIAEADVYVAYGRDEQAEEILLDAMKQHPGRHALRVKLLEIYARRKDLQKFGTLASELRVLTHGHGPEWLQAAQMGQQLDPGNLLYGVQPVVKTTPAPPVTSGAAAMQTAARNEEPLRFSSASTLPSSSTAPAAPSSPSPSISPAAPVSAVIAASSASSLASPPEISSLDASKRVTSSIEDFEIKLEGMLDERRKDHGEGLSLLPQSPAGSLPPFQASAPATTDFQLSGIGIAGDANTSPSASPSPSPSPEQITLKTKIDLALACQEIGDKEGARELLTEVAATRHTELASRAQSLLAQLA